MQALVVVIIGGLLWALTADAFELSTVMWMFGAWVVLFLVLFVIQNLRLHAARKDLLDVGEGPALIVNSDGLSVRRILRTGEDDSVAPTMDEIGWKDMTSIKVGGSSIGSGPGLVVHADDGRQWEVPLSWLDCPPADIDAAVSTASRGRVRVEQAGVDTAD
ncbi:hypothetical protein KJZ00_08325 [Cutibacterium avidum]|uniref:hypothetical protein n=1 Tax=Cutibacterium avidum TaxID=33010 RepID=UPI0007642A34|nr:hypothetical protein [Cutibacterium avidum]KXA67016.1 hypothetical protein HMPREF3223_01265 [Cutibacterium avidum]MCO6631569.1 hypothetical protein [Cutibacterium avidum]MCO6660751.1 hypothetical protein [Cutibacterium avidum]MCO6665255.1 hypothetical protein [Cutibacterium avidum]MCO6669028.1 hypothetical protein [Cutibacterium avidum]